MSTIQVEEETKQRLFSIAAQLQSKRGKKTSLNEAIKHLISVYLSQERDVSGILSLFGCLRSEPKARTLLKELRAREKEKLEELAGKHIA